MSEEIVYGVHASMEALENNQTINKLYLSKSLAKNRAQQFRQTAEKIKLSFRKSIINASTN
ncbi:hypothetical protein X279_04110 [Oenococcus oeni IOEB_0501]|nr:hypothetical protein X279_04110 [Oenococcus oeni IOEB_0501]